MEYKIVLWEDWKRLCESHGVDPREEIEFGVDKGGGDSDDFYYLGEVEEKH